MSDSLSGTSVALVTGAGQGIGRAIALQLARDGFDVAINDISSNIENLTAVSEEVKSLGRASSIHVADVSSEDQVKTMIDEVVKTHRSLDVMVANAGVYMTGNIVDMDVEDWDRLFSINVRGTFLCYKHAGKQMIAQGRGGRIVGAASVVSKQAYASVSAYSGTKWAIRGMTQSAAKELGPHGITVNAYAPGNTDTPMVKRVAEKHAQQSGDLETFYKSLANEAPLKRIGTPEDIANLVSFLVSSKASFITGQSVSCNGGTFCD